MHKRVLFLHKDVMKAKKLKKISRSDLKGVDLVITTYDLVRATCYEFGFEEEVQEYSENSESSKGKVIGIAERTYDQANTFKGYTGPSLLFGVPWNRVMLDESQNIRNPTSKKTIGVMALYGLFKWCLSGTPFVNESADLWSQLRFCGYKGAKKAAEWRKHGKTLLRDHELHDCILKQKVDQTTLPPLNRLLTEIELTKFERDVYDATLAITRKMLTLVKVGEVTYAYMLVMFVYLKQCMISPYLLAVASKRKSDKGGHLLALGDEVFNSYFDNEKIQEYDTDFKEYCQENNLKIELPTPDPTPPQKDEKAPISSVAFLSMVNPSSLANPVDPMDVQEIKAPIPDNATKEEIERAITQADEEIKDLFSNNKEISNLIANIDGPAGIYCTTMNNVIDMITKVNNNPATKVFFTLHKKFCI